MKTPSAFLRCVSSLAWVSLGLCLLAAPAAAAVINDYDGDLKSDLAVYDEDTGEWTVLFSSWNDAPGTIATAGTAGWRPAPGDYDGDGMADIAIVNQSGAWRVFMSGSDYSLFATNFGVAGAGPVSADYDGDGQTDFAYYAKASGEWGLLLSGSRQAVTAQWGGPGLIPAPADFDGDGKDDPCLFHESTGGWYVLLSGSGYLGAFLNWGSAGDQAAPGDFDGDGCADPCVYHKTTGEWQVLSSGSGYTVAAFAICGHAAYKPVPGDFDGDGYADLMVYSDWMADWSAMLSGDGYAGTGSTFGGANWAAVKPLWREDLVFLAFGDSITYGGGSSSDGPATGYPALLETKLRQHYDGYIRSINRGNPGENTYDGFERFAQTLNETSPDLVLLMEGTNDSLFAVPYDEMEENLRNMIQIARNRGIAVILATIPPVISNQYRDRSAQMARIVGFNPRIYGIAADFDIPVARVFESITAVPGWQSSLMDQPSANHPNDAGYQVVRDAFYTPVSGGLNAGQY